MPNDILVLRMVIDSLANDNLKLCFNALSDDDLVRLIGDIDGSLSQLLADFTTICSHAMRTVVERHSYQGQAIANTLPI
ncbi:hypothetical protein KZX29_04300 [Moraxella osloensis]|uniref:hypothetical protein n=1 Tax=Faucicola osloensis TaxID=34062 RepID=UPI0020054E8B|nr:hypothetical protein [Moraxella osloensis]MCK6158018.1 hypothetical protein [Moraxella osloensis]